MALFESKFGTKSIMTGTSLKSEFSRFKKKQYLFEIHCFNIIYDMHKFSKMQLEFGFYLK